MELSATELRIGNWILIPYQNSPIAIPAHETQVQGITIFGEIQTNNTPEHEGLKTHYNHVSGIPLTEEWLLKFGFKYQDRDVSHGNGHIERFYISPYFGEHREYWLELQLNNNVLKTYFAWLMWDIGGGRSFIHLPYGHKLGFVHKLQNVYFELSESELNLK